LITQVKLTSYLEAYQTQGLDKKNYAGKSCHYIHYQARLDIALTMQPQALNNTIFLVENAPLDAFHKRQTTPIQSFIRQ
jgi:hypothetical protein